MTKSIGLCVCALSGIFPLHAVERVWNGADGANWADADVWTTNGVPATAPENADTATINNGRNVNLTSPALNDTNRLALLQLSGDQRGTLVVGAGGYLPVAGLKLSPTGVGPTTPARIVVNGGSVSASGEQRIGEENLNNPGRLEIVNGGSYTSTAAFRVYGGSVLVSNAAFTATFTSYLHGSALTSLFEIVDGSVKMVNFAIGRDINNASGKACRNVLRMRSGDLNLSGTLELGHTGSSPLIITGVVDQAGGTVTIGSGGVINMPITSSAVGYYNLNGGLLSLLNGSGDALRLGGRDSAGKGFFTMTDGVFTNKGNTLLGAACGYGSFSQSGGNAFFEKTIQVGAQTNCTGDLSLSGGVLNLSASGVNINVGNASNSVGRCSVSGGLLNAAGRGLYVGAAPFSSGTFVQNGGIVTNSVTALGAGYASSGALLLSNGLFNTSGNLNVGNQSNAAGRCEVDGGLLNMPGATLVLGAVSNSAGALTLNGGTVTNAGVTAGNAATATGAVAATGGQLAAFGDILIGAGALKLGGTGTFSLSGGKLWTSTRCVIGAFGTGTAQISGGEIEAVGGSVYNGQNVVIGRDPGTCGRLEMTGGALKCTNMLMIARDGGATGTVAVSGGDIYANSVSCGGGLSALSLAGGTLHPYDRANGFVFAATLTNDIGYGDTGTRFGFSALDKDGAERPVSATCTLSGNGGLAKRGAGTVTLGGTLTYTGDTVVEAGTLALSNSVATLACGAIEVRTGATLDVSLNRTTPFCITNGQTLAGGGTVAGDLRIAGGALIGGGSPDAPSVLTLDGDLTLDADSTILLNMLGGSYSCVHVTGDLNLPAAANVTVSGAATHDAEGRAFLAWDGALNMPGHTAWTVKGEKDPLVVINLATRSLTISYRHGTLISVR